MEKGIDLSYDMDKKDKLQRCKFIRDEKLNDLITKFKIQNTDISEKVTQ